MISKSVLMKTILIIIKEGVTSLDIKVGLKNKYNVLSISGALPDKVQADYIIIDIDAFKMNDELYQKLNASSNKFIFISSLPKNSLFSDAKWLEKPVSITEILKAIEN